jgi:hypothetical protein
MSRADLFVYLALVVAWAAIAFWAVRISRKADRLEALMQAAEKRESAIRGGA